MWNYQEILFELKPSLVVEFGTVKVGRPCFSPRHEADRRTIQGAFGGRHPRTVLSRQRGAIPIFVRGIVIHRPGYR